jgi:hypothetical protein
MALIFNNKLLYFAANNSKIRILLLLNNKTLIFNKHVSSINCFQHSKDCWEFIAILGISSSGKDNALKYHDDALIKLKITDKCPTLIYHKDRYG